jgi:hypothetical protein
MSRYTEAEERPYFTAPTFAEDRDEKRAATEARIQRARERMAAETAPVREAQERARRFMAWEENWE